MTTKAKPTEDFLGREFIIEREFDAPRELVFAAWIDPKHLAQWWGPRGFTNPVCEWDARPGGKIYDVMRAPNGVDFPMGGQFLEIAPPERLVFTCGALDEKGKMLFEFKHTALFTELDGKTKLTLRSVVTMTTPDANKYIGGFETGMSLSLERLTDLLRDQPLVIERVFSAPIALLWRALTNKADIERWFFDLPDFQARSGFEFAFSVEHQGTTYSHLCRVTEVVPEQKLAYTWRYEGHAGDSLVSYELFAEGSRTRLRLTHSGLGAFPGTPQFARKNFLGGWTFISDALGDFAENVDREIYVSRVVNAPRELVWEAWTNPKHVANWWGPRGFSVTIESMDFRVGGEWIQVMHGPDGANYENRHVFKEIVKPERIVLSHGGKRVGGPSVRSIATWTFDAVASNKTKVSIRMIFPSAENRDFVAREFKAVEGGQQTLERLGEYMAKMPA
jgi:uncharacterized protein YndB with AHSA1/START domain